MTADVQDCAGPDWTAGRSLLTRMARTGRVFDANLIRSELREIGFSRFTSGRLFQIAEAAGVIRQCGVRKSTDGPSRGAFVREWVGTQHHRVRADSITVRRNADGKFTSTDTPSPTADGPNLLTFMEQS